jgi:hypothetical protein
MMGPYPIAPGDSAPSRQRIRGGTLAFTEGGKIKHLRDCPHHGASESADSARSVCIGKDRTERAPDPAPRPELRSPQRRSQKFYPNHLKSLIVGISHVEGFLGPALPEPSRRNSTVSTVETVSGPTVFAVETVHRPADTTESAMKFAPWTMRFDALQSGS